MPISPVYPAIELLTALLFTALYMYIPHHYFPAYAFFISALLVTVHSDIRFMLVSRFVTLYAIPFGLLASTFGFLPISAQESMLGALLGYGFLYVVDFLFYRFTQKRGMGEGDFELFSFIGSFIGPLGCWFTITASSTIGALFGIFYIFLCSKNKNTKIPFGPFLALGAIMYIFLQATVSNYLFHLL